MARDWEEYVMVLVRNGSIGMGGGSRGVNRQCKLRVVAGICLILSLNQQRSGPASMRFKGPTGLGVGYSVRAIEKPVTRT
jgi:hypothetical protein